MVAVMSRERIRLMALGLVLAGGAAAAALTVLAFAAPLWWLFDLLTHFRPAYAVALIVAAVAAAAAARVRWAVALAIVAAVNGLVMAAALPARSVGVGGVPLRVVVSNLDHDNPDLEPAGAWIAGVEPDLAVLVEVSGSRLGELSAALAHLPHSIEVPGADCSGLVVLSRWPFVDDQVFAVGPAQRTSAAVAVAVDGARPVRVVATHPPPPEGSYATLCRDAHLRGVAERLASSDLPAIVAGDLNATPWSSALREFRRVTGLELAGGRLGPGGTWPSWLPLLRLPIDLLLHDRSIRVVDYSVGPALGSDHLPVVVDLELPAAAGSTAVAGLTE
jgi:endonuclease/exonuclease/phosphatase (EEP) superfamily protein YafD